MFLILVFQEKALNFLEKLFVNEASKFNPNVLLIMSNRNPVIMTYITSAATQT